MDILQQCQKWHENDEYQKIIDTLEAIPAGERTPEEGRALRYFERALEAQGGNSFAVSAYCEKLQPLLQKEEGRWRGGGLFLLSAGYPAGGEWQPEDFRLPGQAGGSIHRRRRSGSAYPHWRSHRPVLRLCGLYLLGHPSGAE